ncbi:hypothetical protein KQI49_00615 [Virgibacillus sp. MSJ-26]|uniref:hypothetical protein n=1 Tax=Virgibacillus sp. MSJ-26 TaxID=2841522 RepID=UPI001C0FEF8E|nr:hypothetical protein [Virgibacillus sp. MSJ-26]MBU5465329.1 hypothetical protein [Virgibacillus sp. MSJ-26]
MKYYLIPLFLLFLIGCSETINEEDLIDGTWIGTAGYKDGKPEGEPYCTPIDEGIIFKDDGYVYIEAYDEDFEYWLKKSKHGGMTLNFRGEHHYLSYIVDKINDNEIGLVGEDDYQKDESCYLERK